MAVVDFDNDDLELPKKFMNQAFRWGLPGYIEKSKSKGFYIWFFFEIDMIAWKAQRILLHLLQKISQPNTEVFPKQDYIDSSTSFGNFINSPLFGKHVPRGLYHCVRQDQIMFPEESANSHSYPTHLPEGGASI